MKLPENVMYTSDHEWIRVDGDTATVGITDYAQGELGDIVFVEIETEGETLAKGEVFGTIEAVKTVSDLFMPAGGEIVEVNGDLQDSPDLVNNEPFDKGWLIRIKLSDKAELDELLDAEQYKDLIES